MISISVILRWMRKRRIGVMFKKKKRCGYYVSYAVQVAGAFRSA